MLELCATRARRLQAGVAPESTLVELLRLLQAPGSVTSKALALGLRGMYGLWRHAGLEPGGEFKAAMEEAVALSPSAAVVYGDQEASVTLQRLAATITLPALLSALGSAFSPSRPVPPELAAALSGKLSAEEAVEALRRLRPRGYDVSKEVRRLHLPGSLGLIPWHALSIYADAVDQALASGVGDGAARRLR